MAVWLGTAVGFGALLALAQASGSTLGDPDPARQRPGFLDAGALPQPAPRLAPALPRSGRPAVAFFVRPGSLDGLCRSLSGAPLAERADVAVVVSGAGRCPEGITVADPAARLARAYGLHRPRAGAASVGYAVVDGHGRIRYRTLDPTVADHLGEVRTIVGAVE